MVAVADCGGDFVDRERVGQLEQRLCNRNPLADNGALWGVAKRGVVEPPQIGDGDVQAVGDFLHGQVLGVVLPDVLLAVVKMDVVADVAVVADRNIRNGERVEKSAQQQKGEIAGLLFVDRVQKQIFQRFQLRVVQLAVEVLRQMEDAHNQLQLPPGKTDPGKRHGGFGVRFDEVLLVRQDKKDVAPFHRAPVDIALSIQDEMDHIAVYASRRPVLAPGLSVAERDDIETGVAVAGVVDAILKKTGMTIIVGMRRQRPCLEVLFLSRNRMVVKIVYNAQFASPF